MTNQVATVNDYAGFGDQQAEPPLFPPTVPARITTTAAKMTATTKKGIRLIGLGDQNGDDRTNRNMDTTTRRINRANQNAADNLTNCRITRSMVRQGLTQLFSFGESLYVHTPKRPFFVKLTRGK